MNSSASLPQRRREALLNQLLDARAQGDQRLIDRAELQWVHRYGVSALAQVSQGLVSVQSVQDSSGTLSAVSAAPLTSVSDVAAVVPDLAVNPEAREAPAPFTRLTTVVKGCLDAVGTAVEPCGPVSAAVTAPLRDVPPPPAPRLQRLRRWLPSVADEFPKAS